MAFPIVNAGVQGLLGAQRSMVKSAQDIATAGIGEVVGNTTATADIPAAPTPSAATTKPGSLIEPMVNMRIEANIYEASAKVVKVADQNLGQLLDDEV